jgi:DNA-binding MarR family transcriptional regulator
LPPGRIAGLFGLMRSSGIAHGLSSVEAAPQRALPPFWQLHHFVIYFASPPGSTYFRMSNTSRALNKNDFEQLSEFRYQMRRFQHFSEQAAHGEGITPLQHLLLLHIKGYPERQWATVGELAERLQAKHHGVVALVSRCEALGLVRRRHSESDRRQVEVHLEPKGEKLLTRLAAMHRAELKSLAGTFQVPQIDL